MKRVLSRELGGIYRGGLTGDEPVASREWLTVTHCDVVIAEARGVRSAGGQHL